MSKTRAPGWWYPWIFVGAFGIIVAVNLTLAYFATSTFTGLATTDAYEKGRLYNRNLALAKAQAELGWQVETKVVPATRDGKPAADIAITYRDRDGKPVDRLEVHAQMIRPTVKGYDHEVQLAHLGGGVYGGVFVLPLNGVWDIDVVALGGGDFHQHEKRFILP